MPVDPTPHLIVPFARCSGDDWLPVVTRLTLKNLGELLGGMKLVDTDTGQIDSLSPPHERVWAKAMGMKTSPDGLIAWAALEASASSDKGWAFITPCHWAMGREHATMTNPATLALTELESRTLLAAMQPYFESDGITLHDVAPTHWLARGDVFASLPTASLDRVLGRNVDRWLPASKQIKLLQNEMQMLLYTHPINDERAARGQRSVNSFWVSGSGALSKPPAPNPQVKASTGLAPAALANDWAAYQQAWERLEAGDLAEFLALQKRGTTVRVSLCGESSALTFETAKRSVLGRIKHLLSPLPPIKLLKQL